MKELLLSKLDKVQGGANGRYRACCPSHGSTGRTLSLLFASDGRILLHCHAGCTPLEVLDSIGLTMTDLFPDGAIRDFMASATVQKSNESTHSDYLLDVCDGMREKGERLSEKDMENERKAFSRGRT